MSPAQLARVATANEEGIFVNLPASETSLTIRQEIENLAPHIPVERFVRIVHTAIAMDPQLTQADRRSLIESAMRAAHNGLLPDKRNKSMADRESTLKKE